MGAFISPDDTETVGRMQTKNPGDLPGFISNQYQSLFFVFDDPKRQTEVGQTLVDLDERG